MNATDKDLKSIEQKMEEQKRKIYNLELRLVHTETAHDFYKNAYIELLASRSGLCWN